MFNINKRIPYINKLINRNATKISIFFSTKTYGDDYDSYNDNYTFTNLNPLTIKGYVTEISAEALVWKQYGLKATGAVEVLCQKKYRTWFENCNKIVIDSNEYEVMREGVGNRVQIQDRPYQLIRVILNRKT